MTCIESLVGAALGRGVDLCGSPQQAVLTMVLKEAGVQLCLPHSYGGHVFLSRLLLICKLVLG